MKLAFQSSYSRESFAQRCVSEQRANVVRRTLEGALDSMVIRVPHVVDAVVNRTELAMPPSITVEMAKGFSLYMVKAILSGRTDEIIDLAKTNLWR